MTLKQIHIRDPRDPVCILCDLHRIPVASVHINLSDISAEKSGQKLHNILLLLFHCLGFVAQYGHSAWKKLLQDQILDPGIILHFIYNKMPDITMLPAPGQMIFQI